MPSPVDLNLDYFRARSTIDENGCWIWRLSKGPRGYGQLCHIGKTMSAHRAAWEVANGKALGALLALHRCDVPACVNPDHIFAGTHQDNMRDRNDKGRARGGAVHGSAHYLSKITEADAIAIRALSAVTSTASIARKYSISHGTASNIIKRRTWTHV